jgi:hypothetical protein
MLDVLPEARKLSIAVSSPPISPKYTLSMLSAPFPAIEGCTNKWRFRIGAPAFAAGTRVATLVALMPAGEGDKLLAQLGAGERQGETSERSSVTRTASDCCEDVGLFACCASAKCFPLLPPSHECTRTKDARELGAPFSIH